MREVVVLGKWQEEVEKIYAQTPASCRPKKSEHKLRSNEKRRAMAKSCKKAWDEWLATGFLKITEEGYKLCPDAMK